MTDLDQYIRDHGSYYTVEIEYSLIHYYGGSFPHTVTGRYNAERAARKLLTQLLNTAPTAAHDDDEIENSAR